MRRLFDLTVVSIWLVSLAGLAWHDLLPAWSAGLPPLAVPAGGVDKPVRMQFAIEARRGGQFGRSWAEFWRLDSGVVARSTTVLDIGPIRRTIRVETNLNFDKDDRLDQLKIWVYGLPVSPVQIEAESYGEDFPCRIRLGDQQHDFTLRQEMASAFSEVLRPFVYLKDLHVGQTWRIASINPVGTLWGEDPAPTPIVARVTGKEMIDYLGAKVDCFRVEAQGAVAWVAPDGRVLLQTVQVPMLGTISIRLLDGFDDEALLQARQEGTGQR
jgi:hypothetical protein